VSTEPSKQQQADAVEDLDQAAKHRLEVDRRLSMSERLAALHELCKQAAAGRAQDRADLENLPDPG
jgi:hypothetical protein